MGIIAEMANQRGGRTGMKLSHPTKDGDNTVIAAKTGEYVLPPVVVKRLGVENLDAWVKSITGKAPGGRPVEGLQEMMGHALGGLIDDLDGPPQSKSAFARTGASSSTMNSLGTTSAQSIIDDKYRAERLNPGAPAAKPAATQGATQPRVAPAGGINYDLPPGKRVGTASMGDFDAARRATSSVASPSVTSAAGITPNPTSLAGTAQQAGAATQGRAYSIGKSSGAFARRAAGPVSKFAAAAAIPVSEAADQFVTGDDADARNQFYNDPNVGWTEKAKQFGRDAAGIALPAAGTVIGAGMGGGLVSVATGVGGYMVGKGANSALQSALGESPLDRYNIRQPQQVADAVMTDRERSDEIARRRAALEGPQSAFAPTQTAPLATTAPTPSAAYGAPTRTPKGPIYGLAARAAQAPQTVDPSTIEGAVEIIRGHNRSWALPETGYQEVPDEVVRGGRIAEYRQAQSQNMVDRADPVAAELRTRLAEIAAQGDNSIRVSNATDRDGKGRGLRNELAQIELEQKKREAWLIQQALEGTPEQRADAVSRLTTLRGGGSNKERTALVASLARAHAASMSNLTPDEYAQQWINAVTGAGSDTQTSRAPQSGVRQIGTYGGLCRCLDYVELTEMQFGEARGDGLLRVGDVVLTST